MQVDDIKLIRKCMRKLVGAQWFNVGRADATAWFAFQINESDYAIFVRSGFRVCTKERVLIAQSDMFAPTKDYKENLQFDWDSYDWSIKGANGYDEWIKNIRDKFQGKIIGTVKRVYVSDFGDLKIEIDNGMIIEIFINSSTKECWSFFKRESEEDLVVFTSGHWDGEL